MFFVFRFLMLVFFRSVGHITYFLSKKRRPITIENINRCFLVKNKDDLAKNSKIARKSFVNLGHSLTDFLLLGFYNKKNIDKYISLKNREYFDMALARNKGVILSTAHFGSWELAAHFLAVKDYKSLILYNPIKKPKFLENWVKRKREIAGNILVAKQSSLLHVYRRLRDRKIVTFISDQHCAPLDGIKAPFFGQNVWTHTAFIKLSLKTGAPIVPGFIFTKSLFGYEIELFPVLYPEDFKKYSDPEYEMARASNLILESAIKKMPDMWMWQHRRFKNLD